MQALSMESFDTKHPLYERLSALGLPKTKTEHYRNFPITPILSAEYSFVPSRQGEYPVGKSLVIISGVVIEAPEGVNVSYMNSFEPDLEHYDAGYFMSHMLSHNIILIEIEKDMVLDIEHWFNHKEAFVAYRVVVKVAKAVSAKVYEHFKTHASVGAFMLYGVDVNLAESSNLTWVRYENRDIDEAHLVGSHHFHCHEQSSLNLATFDFGGVNSLHLYKIDLEEKSQVDASHLLLAFGEARRGNVIYINHKGEHAKSTQEARAILREKALGIFDAKIAVGHDAKYASAMQNSKAILLDEHAHMYAKPQLEIYTDELEASHGSTIGTLDEEALFYLCSRGIKRKDAKRMLVLAFANSFIDKLDNEAIVEQLHNDFEQTI